MIDRFFSVFAPFYYPKRQLKVVVVLSIASWVFSLVIGLIQIPPILDCYTYSETVWLCSAAFSRCGMYCQLQFTIFLVLVVIPAIIIPIILYTILFVKAMKIMKATPSPAVKNRHKKECKATVTFFLLFLSVILTTIPGAVSTAISNIFYSDITVVPPALFTISTISTVLFLLLLITDPIVIMRHKDVKETIKGLKFKIMKKWCPSLVKKEVVEQITLGTIAT